MLLVGHETDRMDTDEELALLERWRGEGDRRALHRLIRSHIRGVIVIAREYRHRHGNLDDLIQEGMIGLLRAVKRFDPTRGTRFFSYAAWWIRASIREHLLQTRRLVRIGRSQAERRVYQRLGRVRQEVDQRYPDLEPESRLEKMAELIDTDPEVLRTTRARLSGAELTLDSPIVIEGPARVVDTVPGREPAPDEIASRRELRRSRRAALGAALDRLSARERGIIEQRFLVAERRTLRAIGEDLGVSRERVRQVQNRGLRKMRHYLEAEHGIGSLGLGEQGLQLGAA